MIESKFKDSELGLIPEDWSCGCFKDFLTYFSAGATPYRGNPSNFVGNIPWISSGELNYDIISDTNEHISINALKSTHLTLHEKGTFLIAITGLEAAGTRGRCAFVGVPAATNQSCLAIKSTEKLSTRYLFWYYRLWSNYLAFNFSQGSKQQSFTAEIVKKLPLYAPTIDEQERIAEALSDVDALIKELDALIDKKRMVLKATMQDLLTARRRLPGFSEPWKEVKLGDLVNIHSGDTITAQQFVTNGHFPVYGANGIRGKYNSFNLDGEFILIGRVGALCGNIHISKGKVWASEHTLVCYPHSINLFSPVFLAHILERMNLIQYSGASAQPVIASNKLKPLLIRMPNLSEQQAIAEILSDMDAEIAELEKKKEKYTSIRQGMMQQLLTGKIRLI